MSFPSKFSCTQRFYLQHKWYRPDLSYNHLPHIKLQNVKMLEHIIHLLLEKSVLPACCGWKKKFFYLLCFFVYVFTVYNGWMRLRTTLTGNGILRKISKFGFSFQTTCIFATGLFNTIRTVMKFTELVSPVGLRGLDGSNKLLWNEMWVIILNDSFSFLIEQLFFVPQPFFLFLFSSSIIAGQGLALWGRFRSDNIDVHFSIDFPHLLCFFKEFFSNPKVIEFHEGKPVGRTPRNLQKFPQMHKEDSIDILFSISSQSLFDFCEIAPPGKMAQNLVLSVGLEK